MSMGSDPDQSLGLGHEIDVSLAERIAITRSNIAIPSRGESNPGGPSSSVLHFAFLPKRGNSAHVVLMTAQIVLFLANRSEISRRKIRDALQLGKLLVRKLCLEHLLEKDALALIVQRHDGPVSEQALSDCIRTIRTEQQMHNAKSAQNNDELLSVQKQLLARKGLKT